MPTQPRQDKLKDVLNIKSPIDGTNAAIRKPRIDEASVDIGALMRKALAAPKLRTGAEGTAPTAAAPVAAPRAPAGPSGTSIEFRGNPIYSPDDSLAKAATKLATLKAAGATPGPAPAATRKPRPSDAATPGWRPEAEGLRAGGADDVPLAARTLMAKRNRRKSVYQRPTRYGDWFDGDDEELEKMVEEHNGDEEAAQAAHEAAKAARKAAAEKEAAAAQQKDRAARRKSAFPSVGQREAVAAELAAAATPVKSVAALDTAGTRGAPTPAARGTDIVNKVRAIADGLCERLDGLIEESPALPRGARRDEKSLRDKLLESWEGRSYYDRLMQMAGGAAEQEELKEELAAASAAAAAKDPTPEPEVAPHAGALSFLSPPKPKLRADVAAALQAATAAAAVRPKPVVPVPAKQPAAQEKTKEKEFAPAAPAAAPVAPQQPAAAPLQVAVPAAPAAAPAEGPRGPSLLKVSARGTKPMPAPWQQQASAPTEPAAGKKDPTPSPAAAAPSAAVQAQLAAQAEEIDALRAALAEANAARQTAEKEAAEARAKAEAARARLAAMEEKLEEAEEDAKTEATVRMAAEKRIHTLEAEIESLQAAGGAAEGAGKALNKVAEGAAEVEGKFGLMEVQLEALMTAAESLSKQLAAGRGAATAVSEAAQAAVSAGDAAPALRRTRRKSAWRG